MMLGAWFESGRIVDLILVLVGAEILALWFWLRGSGSALRLGVIANAAAGACLLLALRLALGGAWWGWIAACLAASFAAHLIDLIGRLRR